MMRTSPRRRRVFPPWCAAACLCLLSTAAAGAAPKGQTVLAYEAYRLAMRAAERLDHVASVESLEDADGPVLALGDRFGLLRLVHLTGYGADMLWTSKQLTGVVQEVIAADLDGDAKDEIIAWTNAAMIYVWGSVDQRLRYETLQSDFTTISCLAVGNVDDDPALDIVVNADKKIYYIDGVTFNREWTSLQEYEAGRMAIGDVDGDHIPEIVLNTGQVLNTRTGDVEWGDEVFGARLELLDIDGDGILEVLTESDGSVMRIFDVDERREKHLQ